MKRLSITHENAPNSLHVLEAMRAPKNPWRGFPRRDSTQQSQPVLARLEMLVLTGNWDGLRQLTKWTALTDFAFLRYFVPTPRLTPDMLAILTSMAEENKFRSLRSLGLSVSTGRHHDASACDESASLLLAALPPLEALSLRGCVGPLTLHTLLHRHGPTLRTLHFLPRLESLTIHPWRGSPHELAAYRALGSLAHLARLTLLLACACGHFDNDDDDEEKDEAQKIRAALARCAVDAALARAVFAELTAAGASLERLRLEPLVVGNIGVLDYDELARWVARVWVCERRRERSGELAVREVRVKDGWVGAGETYLRTRDELERVDQECKNLWNEMWPSKGGDWRDEWSSFLPLGR